MNTIKITFGALNVLAASLLAANVRFIGTVNVHNRSSFANPVKLPETGKISPILQLDSILRLDTMALVVPDVFKKNGRFIRFNVNPTPGVVFRIQVLASKEQVPLFTDRFKGLDDIKEEYVNGLFKYTVGDFRQPAESEHTLNEVKSKGYIDAYLVAFKDEKRISVNDAIKSFDPK